VITRTVRLAEDLHARPCSAVAQAMKRFKGSLELRLGGRKADARSVLEMMTLEARQGADVELLASGEDAGAILAAITALLR
jgi:phosphotransferase system HPr (HPr) family protein